MGFSFYMKYVKIDSEGGECVKKYIMEIIILLTQLFMFYIFPLFAGPTDAMGMVFLIIAATLLLSLVIGAFSSNVQKYFYPLCISLLFVPSIWLYYNVSASVHALWYFVISLAGVLTGAGIRHFVRYIRRQLKK